MNLHTIVAEEKGHHEVNGGDDDGNLMFTSLEGGPASLGKARVRA